LLLLLLLLPLLLLSLLGASFSWLIEFLAGPRSSVRAFTLPLYLARARRMGPSVCRRRRLTPALLGSQERCTAADLALMHRKGPCLAVLEAFGATVTAFRDTRKTALTGTGGGGAALQKATGR
jgi:hypothetical protein